MKNLLPLIAILLSLTWAPETGLARQQAIKKSDPAVEAVKAQLQDAQREIEEFEKGGGKKSDAGHPIMNWTDRLWETRKSHPGSDAAKLATSEAIHLLVHADRFSEVQMRADSLKPDDPAWESVPNFLVEGAARQKNYAYAIHKLTDMSVKISNPKVRARVDLALGRAQHERGQTAEAEAALRRVMDDEPGSPIAREAERIIYEMANLEPGKSAPDFSLTTRANTPVSIAGYRGQVVLLIFWAST